MFERYSLNIFTQLINAFLHFVTTVPYLCHFQITADTPDPEGGTGTFVRDKDGNLTGQMFEAGALTQFTAKAGSPTSQTRKSKML